VEAVVVAVPTAVVSGEIAVANADVVVEGVVSTGADRVKVHQHPREASRRRCTLTPLPGTLESSSLIPFPLFSAADVDASPAVEAEATAASETFTALELRFIALPKSTFVL
jgi:hypothetical protein